MKTPREILLNRHLSAGPRLDDVRAAALAAAFPDAERHSERVAENSGPLLVRAMHVMYRELILPCRGIWAGLAAVWLVILVLNFNSGEKPVRMATRTAPPNSEVLAVLREQREMLAQFLEPAAPSPAVPAKTTGPRGELPQTITFV